MVKEYRSIDGYIASRIHTNLVQAGIKAQLRMNLHFPRKS